MKYQMNDHDAGDICCCGGMPEDAVAAMAYVPWQCMQDTYDPEKALRIGTIFPELDKPFTGRKGGRR